MQIRPSLVSSWVCCRVPYSCVYVFMSYTIAQALVALSYFASVSKASKLLLLTAWSVMLVGPLRGSFGAIRVTCAGPGSSQADGEEGAGGHCGQGIPPCS